ncbi:endonuclease III [Candidatus Micrarchaeota archaeon]|nr:endonuclease III [Candidatus Micrarchaeota archaeon]
MEKPNRVLQRLRTVFGPNTAYSGSETTPFRILVGTLLSARTKDLTTARVAHALFAKYPDAPSLAKASIGDIEKIIRPIGFFHAKARYVKTLAQKLVAEFDGQVPDTMDALVSLPGVGRKTASCVLNYAFQKPAIAVDVHVHRISNWLRLVKTKTPEQTEMALKQIYRQSQWRHVNNAFVLHGQNVCLPASPKCSICVLNELCPKRRQAPEMPLKARFLESRKVFNQSWRIKGFQDANRPVPLVGKQIGREKKRINSDEPNGNVK